MYLGNILIRMVRKNSIILMTLLFSLALVSIHSVDAKLEPLVWHDYEYFNLTLAPGYCEEFTSEPYAVSVHIDEISPTGYSVDVTIYAGSELKWSGQLGEGENSPTITCNDQYTEVHIANPNGNPPLDDVIGYIDWVMH